MNGRGSQHGSLTPTKKLESYSSNLRRYDRDVQCKSGSTKRIPKRVRLNVSRTSRTDEAAEPPRKPLPPSRSVEKAREGAQSRFFRQCSYRESKQLQQGLPRELIHTWLLNPYIERCWRVPSFDAMAEPSLRTTDRRARHRRRQRRPARSMRQ